MVINTMPKKHLILNFFLNYISCIHIIKDNYRVYLRNHLTPILIWVQEIKEIMFTLDEFILTYCFSTYSVSL